ncbi:Hypothetical predicted protein [Cloeon dipterum]|uniref:Peptidase S1 domain-containing protein n=2 Tax=Cloeon dipterum TaxID=197152 RepID=A0A8S1D6B0_9INSE|nr:Hypothetical predicted protein [Cloeon dipterum]
MRCNSIAFLIILLLCNLNSASKLRGVWNPEPKRDPQATDRIYGGVEAGRDEFPFMAAVILGEVALCGGALVSSTSVLTSAQCLLTSFEVINVHLGVHNLTDDTETGRIIIKATRTIVHEQFNSLNLDNDIGIIKLPMSVEASNILPVALPSRSFAEGNSFENYTARIFGWGLRSSAPSAIFSDILQTAESMVINNTVCEDIYELFVPYVTPLKLCLDNSGLSGACIGDAGGPIVTPRPEDGKFVLIGTISFSAGPCGYEMPVIAARLSLYLDWIGFYADVAIDD